MEKFVKEQNDYLFGAFEPLLTKLEMVGEQAPVTFECPTDEDMKKFPLDMQIKLCGVMTKVDEEKVLGERALKGIQLQFTNDVHTPVYQTKWGEDLPPRVTVVS